MQVLTRIPRRAPPPAVDSDRLPATRVALHTVTLDDDVALLDAGPDRAAIIRAFACHG
ncbi:hypothetical protein [Micromonospora sp. WMMD998]|uniref:hypothetical protein n=1 Tax=Micromonospora sp. WMMD998 TaxID=3016092 RepID=UPI00249AB36E|nr:hypothetical protein [Micromonospora sp. WMMD998]WFE39069.1 hypothetical protein O7619_11785 [Micromonospora sp. WMMD998]